MVLPEPFTTASPVNASFDFSDIRSGTGMQTYYLFDSVTSAGTDEHLGETAVYSDNTAKSIEGTGGALSKDSDKDFDLTILNMPQNIQGTALIQMPYAYEITNGTGTGTIYMVCRVKKNDVEIGSVQSESITATTAVTGKGVWLLPVVIPYTHFEVGDVLRLTVELWATSDGGESCYFAYGIDPIDRALVYHTQTFTTTTSKIFIPYKMDI